MVKRKLSDTISITLNEQQLAKLAEGHKLISQGQGLALQGQNMVAEAWSTVIQTSEQTVTLAKSSTENQNKQFKETNHTGNDISSEPLKPKAKAARKPKIVPAPQVEAGAEPKADDITKETSKKEKKERTTAKRVTGYNMFVQETRKSMSPEDVQKAIDQVTAENNGEKRTNALAVYIGKVWGSLTPEQKQVFDGKAQVHNEQLLKEFEQQHSQPAATLSPEPSQLVEDTGLQSPPMTPKAEPAVVKGPKSVQVTESDEDMIKRLEKERKKAERAERKEKKRLEKLARDTAMFMAQTQSQSEQQIKQQQV